MVHAPRGCGKTLFALGAGWAIATGSSFLKWKAVEPRPVVYLDGEMPIEAMKERFQHLVISTHGRRPSGGDRFRLVSLDHQGDELLPLSLSTAEAQQRVEELLEPGALLVIDNVSCLFSAFDDNKVESWSGPQEWLLRLRRQGMAVLLIHHSAKSGTQRGTSRREDVLDVVLSLSRPSDYEPEQGARFLVEFSKARHLMGEDAESLEAQYDCGEWTWKPAEDHLRERVLEMVADGIPQRQIAMELGLSQSRVSRIKRRKA